MENVHSVAGGRTQFEPSKAINIRNHNFFRRTRRFETLSISNPLDLLQQMSILHSDIQITLQKPMRPPTLIHFHDMTAPRMLPIQRLGISHIPPVDIIVFKVYFF